MFIGFQIDINSHELILVNNFLKDHYMANSQWLTDVLAAILTISQGGYNDTAIQAKVASLSTQLGTDEGNSAATNAEFKTAIAAIVKQLAVAPAPTGAVPVVSSLSAANGSVNGGETVTVTGSGFTNGTPVAHFGAMAGTALAVQSDTSLTVVSPAQAKGTVDVTVSSPGGVSAIVAADQYLYA